MHKIKSSFSVFHCVNTEAFLFFWSRWRQSQETPQQGSVAQPLALCALQAHSVAPSDGFCPLKTSALTDCPRLPWGRKLYCRVCICMRRMWPFSAVLPTLPSSWLRSSHCPCDTWSQESLEQPTAGSLFLLACGAQTLLQNKMCHSHLCRWKGLFQDDFIRGQMVAVAYTVKDQRLRIKRLILWVLVSARVEGSTQHLCKDRDPETTGGSRRARETLREREKERKKQ